MEGQGMPVPVPSPGFLLCAPEPGDCTQLPQQGDAAAAARRQQRRQESDMKVTCQCFENDLAVTGIVMVVTRQ